MQVDSSSRSCYQLRLESFDNNLHYHRGIQIVDKILFFSSIHRSNVKKARKALCVGRGPLGYVRSVFKILPISGSGGVPPRVEDSDMLRTCRSERMRTPRVRTRACAVGVNIGLRTIDL